MLADTMLLMAATLVLGDIHRSHIHHRILLPEDIHLQGTPLLVATLLMGIHLLAVTLHHLLHILPLEEGTHTPVILIPQLHIIQVCLLVAAFLEYVTCGIK